MDIAQETFLKLLSNIQQFRGDSSFDSWLYRLVVNSCLDHHRRRRRFLPLMNEVLDVFRAPNESALHDLLRHEQEEHVQQVVAQLPDEQRMVVVLRYTEGLSYEEIAGPAGLPPGHRGVALEPRPQGAGTSVIAVSKGKDGMKTERFESELMETELSRHLGPVQRPTNCGAACQGARMSLRRKPAAEASRGAGLRPRWQQWRSSRNDCLAASRSQRRATRRPRAGPCPGANAISLGGPGRASHLGQDRYRPGCASARAHLPHRYR